MNDAPDDPEGVGAGAVPDLNGSEDFLVAEGRIVNASMSTEDVLGDAPLPSKLSRVPGLDEALRRHREYRERDARILTAVAEALARMGDAPFPLDVFPATLQEYVRTWAASLCCSVDLLAVPLLSVAGAAIGRSGRRLRVKDSWEESSCLWTACLAPSSEGKSPALAAVGRFYMAQQRLELQKWGARKKEAAKGKTKEEREMPPRPTLFLSDTTAESLRHDLAAGPVLYLNDGLSAWCHQMGQYKVGNADRPTWCSFWSHAPVSVGRRTDSVYIDRPFVSVTGMMVPGSARELNYRGHGDDGFVHRILIACPSPSPMLFVPAGVPDALTARYETQMKELFTPPIGGRVLRVDERAFERMALWCNDVHYAAVAGPGAPDWLKAKYKKLWTNFWRIALVLHELRRVAEAEGERAYGGTPFDPALVDIVTLERAIRVVDYFKAHIPRVQNHLGDEPADGTDGLVQRFRPLGEITLRDFMHRTTYKAKSRALAVFAEWQKRGYGTIGTGVRSDQVVFRFAERAG